MARKHKKRQASSAAASTVKWMTLIVVTVTGSITWKLMVVVVDDSSSNSNNHLMLDLPRGGLCGDTSTAVCQDEYERVTSNFTLTKTDLQNSRALLGNRHRLAALSKKLKSNRPVNAVVCGGSITMARGVTPFQTLRYSHRLQVWMNENYPITGGPHHEVHNFGSHGADICAMAKRINTMIQNLPPDPDLFVLEFAVNDYQGQDHKVHVDHKTDVFFHGFERLVVCAESVVYRLLSEFPNATQRAPLIASLKGRPNDAKENRKTAAALHMAVAKHYQVPVISYAETLFPDFYRLVHMLKDHEYSTATISSSNSTFTGDPVLPYPHGCVPCLDGTILEEFRDKGCKSLCVFVKRSGNNALDCNNVPHGRQPCYVSFLAHDAVHPSAIGHQLAADLIGEAIARTERDVCDGQELPPQILPTLGLMVSDPVTLAKRNDFVLVQDTMEMFGDQDELEATRHSEGFELIGDFTDRPGWVATNILGNEYVEFTIDLPEKPCYVVYVAVLKSYEKVGTFTVNVTDWKTGKETLTKADALWEPRISVPSDFPVTQDNVPGCTGRCIVRITTDPHIEGRKGNKVKIMTLSARECICV